MISIELKFTSSTADKYKFLNRSYDRSGRLHMDSFIFDKKDKIADPLYDYFYRSATSFIAGGLFTVPTLDSKPQIVNFELNEYALFKEPGKYRLYVVSPRVGLKDAKDDPFEFGEDAIPVTSNILEFEIVPADRKWQEEKLAEAVKLISRSSTDDREGCNILRFLGTKEAAKEMIVRYSRGDKTCQFENYIGLFGSPEREFIVNEMEKMLVSPNFSVTNGFFKMLVNLSYFLNNPETEKSESKDFETRLKKAKEEKDLIQLNYLESLLRALANKDKSAFAKSLETYFSFHAKGEKQPPAELKNALTNGFGELPKGTQQIILANSWDKLKNPAMLPVLQAIYNNFGRPNPYPEAFEDYYDRELFNLSIKGIYDLDPNIGKQIILTELRRPDQRVYTQVLELLPKSEASEVEKLLLEKLVRENVPTDDLDSIFTLIDHYETPQLISKLRETYAERIDKIGCQARITLLKIFLKSDIDFGAKMLDKAVKGNTEENCHGSILANAIDPYWSPEIERIVLVGLESDDLFVFNSAVKLLGKHGSVDVRDKIWKRFERFSQEEKNKRAETEKKDWFANFGVKSAESDFVVGLSESPNWWFDEEPLDRASGLCVYDYCKERVEEIKKIFGSPLKIQSSIDEDGQISFSVSQYKRMSLDVLKKKLAQFPPDTTFTWVPNSNNPDSEKQFRELKEFVEGRRMNLVK
ncbi:MAG: hypothetical protein R2747_15235 [Pyrinomonadaceae bacterium]